jgi:hypothetical protein
MKTHRTREAIILLMCTALFLCAALGSSEELVRDFCAINGVSFFHLYESPKKWEIAGDRLRAADWLGLAWHRCDFWWGRIESEKDRFDFSYSDRVVERFLEHGRRLMPILCYSTAWQSNNSPVTSEAQDLYARYVYNVVNRYKDKIKDWEIWNEPNITPFWVPKPDPRDYAQLLKRAYKAAKNADEGCNVVGLCTAGADYPFIESVYDLGGGQALDTLSYHHYDDRKDESVLEREIYEIKSIMNRYGDAKKKIWITEMGLATGAVHEVGKLFSEGDQAVWLVKKLVTAMSTRIVERVFWFTINDWTPDPYAEGHMGVFDFDLVPKPAAFAYRAFLRLVGDSEYVGSLMLTPTATCHVFKNARREVMGVIWTKNLKENVLLFFEEKEPSIYSLYGERGSVKPSGHAAELDMTPIPIYVTGLDKAYSLLGSVKSEEVPILVALGQEKEVAITVENVCGRSESFEISAELQGDNAVISSGIQKVRGGDKVTIKGAVSVDNKAQPGWKELRIKIKSSRSPRLERCYAIMPVKVIQPLEMRVELKPEGSQIKLNGIAKNVCLENLAGSLSWRLEPEGKVSRGPEQIKSLPPNAIKEFGAHLRAGYGEKKVSLVAQVDVCEGREFSAHRRVAGMPFMDKAAFAIDGSLSDWQGILPLTINSKEQLVLDKGAGKWSSGDLSGVVRLCCDKEDLFVALDITDDQPMINPYAGTDIWRGDGAELYIGFGGPTPEHWYGEKDFQIGLTPGRRGEAPYCWLWKTGGVGRKLEKAQVAVQKIDRGYVMEARIPLSELGVGEIEPPALVGFDIALNDLDERGERAEKDRALMWNGSDTNWRDPANWGVVRFQRTAQ